MKNIFTLLFIIFSSFAFVQTFGNEWIKYDQKYFSFKIVEDGVYKIDYETLIANGIEPSQFSSSNIQIFGKEKEQAIYLFDGGDNQLNPGDFFIFYAQRNDGWLDSTLFRDPSYIGNPGQSMFNDTIHYFFTWNNSSNNLRYTFENFNGYQNIARSPFVLDEIVYSPNAAYNPAKVSTFDPSSLFDPGEGYCIGFPDGAVTSYVFDYNFNIPNIVTSPSTPQGKLHVKTASFNNALLVQDNPFNHHTRFSMGSVVLSDILYTGYQQIIFDTVLPNSFLQNNTNFRFEILNDIGVLTDRQTLTYLSLKYPKTTNLLGANSDKFKAVNNSLANRIRLDITNAAITNPLILVLSPRPKFVNPLRQNDTIFAVFTNSFNGLDQEVIIQDFSAIKKIDSIKKVNGTGNFTDFTSLDFNESNLIIYHPKLQAASNEYIAYRSQTYNVVAANIEELYLQFGGGIEKHSNAIRRFAYHAYIKAFTSKPLAITILGKGLRNDYTKYNPVNFQNSWIPPFGSPGSDIFYTSYLHGNQYSPLIPIGRVSVTSNQDLRDYLNKLKEYETEQDQSSVYNSQTKDWQKQILHFVGGSNAEQVALFESYLKLGKVVIEDSLFAGNVTTFRKHTSSPLDPTLLDEIGNYIKYGASIMNFFGHSGSIGFDISVDDPSMWDNRKKYPVIIGNGCHAAAIYETANEYAFSEKIVKTANNGGIAYFASGAEEYDITLRDYSHEIYKQISYKNYGKPFAFQIKEAISILQNQTSSGNKARFHSTLGATNLNGDPLLKVNYHNKPEIEITEQSVYFTPENITLQNDSIDLNLILTNLGRSVLNDFNIEIRRNFPLSNIDSVYNISIPKLHYKDTIILKIPLQANIAIGINNFEINVDLPSLIPEQYDEINNNKLNKIFYLKVDGILPVLPYQYAVVPVDTVSVIGSTIDPIAGFRTYFFELDTTDLFNSPIKRKKTVTGFGGVKTVKWNEWMDNSGMVSKPLIDVPDSTVFFWRVAVDSSTLAWNESSFQYIKGKEGWGQDHFFQFKNNSFLNIEYNRNNRRRQFSPVSCTFYANLNNLNPFQNWWGYTCGVGEYATCSTDPSFHVTVLNPNTLKAWETNCNNPSGYSFGQTNDNCACRQRTEKYFIFRQNETDLPKMMNMLSQIPDDHYVLISSIYEMNYQTVLNSIPEFFDWLQAHGSTSIHTPAVNKSFLFFTQLNNNLMTHELSSTDYNQELNISFDIFGADYIGTENSTIIGPALEWKTVYWKQDPLETTLGDTTTLKITGYNFFNNTSIEVKREFTRNDSIINFNSIINASLYPFLKLDVLYKDNITATPAQVDRWHVLYSPVPEAAIDNTNAYTLYPQLDTIKEGQRFIFAADYKNISNIHMDSMLVKYWIEDANHNRHFLNYPRQDSLRISQTFRDTIEINTTGFPGLNSLWMEINPYIDANQTIPDQLEQHHFNNILQVPFYVKGDDINPILDVTFDGRHILNKDIVNPKSQIVITLKDDNPFLVMNDVSDTTLFGIYLTEPGGIQRRIPFMDQNGNEVLQWIPAEPKNKKFKIIYNSNFLKDGLYTLSVQGADRSGNLSGDLDYRITFEVINESTITYLMNYPNPFSTSTRFVFTLTGTEVPDDIIIQIMTVTGKVVREITEDELGPIYIGRNITQYAWNGTDEFGDPLANGVYLYRVLSQLDGEKIKHRQTGADKYFKKEFGKMYLMR
jgi:hypothetical protein